MFTDNSIQNLKQIFANLQSPSAPLGGSWVVWHQGDCVLNQSIGVANFIDGMPMPWTADTLSLNYSTGKGVLATLIHVLVSQGVLAYDIPIARYWPAFAANGKAKITLRAVLSHRAGLFAISDMVNANSELLDWQEMLKNIEQMPIKEHAGYLSAYSALVSGWVLGGLIEKATNMSLQKALDTYLAEPLGIKGAVFFQLPESLTDKMAMPKAYFCHDNNHNTSAYDKANTQQGQRHKPIYRQDTPEMLKIYQSLPNYDCWQNLIQSGNLNNKDEYNINTAMINGLYFNPKNMSIEYYKAAMVPERKVAIDYHQKQVLISKIPAANCVASANALATIYNMLANGGNHQGQTLIDSQTFNQLSTVQPSKQLNHNQSMQDAVMPAAMSWRLGYHRVFSVCHEMIHGFGHMGYNGSVAWCDPSRQLSMAYVHNFDATMLTDIRQFALTEAVLLAVSS